MKNRLLFIDTETGGVDPSECSLFSIGFIVWEDGKIIFEKEIFIKDTIYKTTSAAIKLNNIDISKLDEAFTSGKGYYELIAENTTEGILKKYIFRFNIVSFRNNYSIADLSKMDLNYYAVKVGKSEEEMLDISKEFNFEQKSISSAFDIVEDQNNSNMLDVYDVILAVVDI
jgi:hypothetical protein